LFQQRFDRGIDGLEEQLQAVMHRNVDPSVAAHALLGWQAEGQGK
jgi:hypothetical protein